MRAADLLRHLVTVLEGGSEKHLRDIKAMLEISGDEIDVERVERGAEALGLQEIWSSVS